MDHSGTNAAESTPARGKIARHIWLLGKRRNFLVPGPYQIRSILNISVLSAILLIAVDVIFYQLIRYQSAAALEIAPELTAVIRSQDGYQMKLMILGSIVAFLGIVATAMFETHKTAGPLYNLAQTMQRLTEEGPAVRVRFRKEDHYREVEAAFNAMATSLEAQSLQRREEIGRIAEALRRESETLSGGGAQSQESASRLNVLSSELTRIEL